MTKTVSDNRTVTPTAARSAILSCFKAKRPVFLWGPPGIGKSEIVESITSDLKGHMIDLRLAQMDPTDIKGIPFFNKNLGVMDWAPPIEMPTEELASKYPIVVLFLDEMNSAAPAVQAAGYQLILNRKIGKYSLPDNVVIVAAGNRESDRGVTYRMPTPLANRFVHLEMRVNFDSWQEWAIKNKIHKDVVGYLSFAKQDLHDFDSKSSSRAFATPRSWSFVSDLLSDPTSNAEILTDLIAGTVGEGMAIKFMAHRRTSSKLPLPYDILIGKEKKLNTQEISAMYSLVVATCYELDELAKSKDFDDDEFHDMTDNFIFFMLKNFETELIVMGLKTLLTAHQMPINAMKLKSFDEFHEKYGKYILKNAM